MNPPAVSAAHSILVAEDNRVMSDVMRFNLQKAGYHVTIARNGTEAWELLQSARFDVLVTDYQMPGLTGEEVCKAMRTHRPDLHLPIIFLSARGLELSVERMKSELGIETLLHKPFSPRELLEAVAKCVEKTTVPV
ncbi:MAG: response regulator [Planctomycetaceae bacterium]|jgi:two-component system alkaline phosphatase synthesis response regulator PhoP|nr:response regulator [Planctomycetaceae bacterium]